jgi:hypothetical protein
MFVMLIRLATVLAGSAALALTVPALAADPTASPAPHHATVHKTTHHKPVHHKTTHHSAKHHATHHAASTKTVSGGTTTHTVAPKSGTMMKSSTTVHKAK